MTTKLQFLVTVDVSSGKYKRSDTDIVQPACGRAIEEALQKQQDEGFNHALDDTTMLVESVKPIVANYTRLPK